MDHFQRLLQLFKSAHWEEGQALWLQILEQELTTAKPLKEIAQELIKRGQQKLLQEMLAKSVQNLLNTHDLNLRLEVLHLFAEFRPDTREFMLPYMQAFIELHRERKYIKDMAVRINQKRLTLLQFIDTLDKLLVFQEGSIVKHKSGWGIGKVLSIHPETMRMVVDLQAKPKHDMDILAASDCLIPLAPDNFEAMLVFQPDILKREAEEDILKLLHRILEFHKDEISAREFKEYLCKTIIPEEKWTKWWGQARKELLKDPYVEANAGAHSKYKLRKEPMGWEDEIRGQFDQTLPLEQPLVILEYIKHTNIGANYEYFGNTLLKLCQEYMANQQPWYAFECYLILEICIKNGGLQLELPKLDTIIGKDIIAIYNNLRINALAQDTLNFLLKFQPEWDKHLGYIFKKGTDLARDTLYKYLQKDKKRDGFVVKIAQEIIGDPLNAPDGLLWFARQVFNDKLPRIEGITGFYTVLVTLIRTGGTLKSLRQNEIVKKINKIFSSELAKKILKTINKLEAFELFQLLETVMFLPANFKQGLQDQIKEKHSDLFEELQQPIYTTEEGLARYQAELSQLSEVEIPKNQKAIGDALALGDLSENAELDAAREIQFQLADKLKKMKHDIARAKVIDFDRINLKKVCIGCTVTLEDAKKNQIQYSILGPWDVDTEKGIISFLSPNAKAMLDASCGDTISLPNGTYTIVSIMSYQTIKK